MTRSLIFLNDTNAGTANRGYTLEVQGNTANYVDSGDFRLIRKPGTSYNTTKVSLTQPVNIRLQDAEGLGVGASEAAVMSYINYQDVLPGGTAGTSVKENVNNANFAGPVNTVVLAMSAPPILEQRLLIRLELQLMQLISLHQTKLIYYSLGALIR